MASDEFNFDMAALDMDLNLPTLDDHSEMRTHSFIEESDYQQRVSTAVKAYPVSYFYRFLFTGDDAKKMTQIALEEHFYNE